MQLNTLKRTHKNKKTRQIGRAGGRGKTSGRGTKGQNARAGHKKRPEIRDFIKRLPKLRGRGKNINTSVQTKAVVVNFSAINKAFKDGDTVSPETLLKAGIIKKASGVLPKIKILGQGEISKKVKIVGCQISGSAKEALVKFGGEVASVQNLS